MDSAVQYIKDFQGNDILAVLPIERERAIGDEEEEIPEAHKHILDERIEKYKNHPEDFITYEELKRSIRDELGIQSNFPFRG
ncbi:addiction module protein [Capnocytophaga genosp. AHN8471]|uniref:addiction module protein n=1 Tax=Capnocytophaga genosp. AHN8471 TaxID=327574 RepID=UPI0019336BCD|nr:addiction module protein [Capnocytophaga genosp. AHN8471]MBM0652818.1 addiction module protein [Capnocytophaga genosp. AHN8471]